LSLDETNGGWVYVRDGKTDLTYYGYISAFSDSHQERELLLSDVDVYGTNDLNDMELYYSVDYLYIARNRDDLTIEIPATLEETPTTSEQTDV